MVANMEVELTALGPELTKKSLATEKLMEKLEVDQAEADKVNIFYFFVIYFIMGLVSRNKLISCSGMLYIA